VATLETYVRADDTDAHRFADTLTTTRVGVDPTGAPRLEDLDDLAGLDDPAPDGSGTAQLTLHRVEPFPPAPGSAPGCGWTGPPTSRPRSSPTFSRRSSPTAGSTAGSTAAPASATDKSTPT